MGNLPLPSGSSTGYTFMTKHDNNTPGFPEEPDLISLDEATTFLNGDGGKVFYDSMLSYCSFVTFGNDYKESYKSLGNGTCFFVKSPTKLFLVTAAHVFEGFREAKLIDKTVKVFVGSNEFDLEARLISTRRKGDPDGVDVATFELSDRDLSQLPGKFAIEYWPPLPPEEGRGVALIGFPAKEIRDFGQGGIGYGSYRSTNIAVRVTDRHIEVDLQHRDLSCATVLGSHLDINYDMGGMSGGPVFTIVMKKSVNMILPAVGGVISEWRPGIDSVFAEKADCIRSNGMIRGNH